MSAVKSNKKRENTKRSGIYSRHLRTEQWIQKAQTTRKSGGFSCNKIKLHFSSHQIANLPTRSADWRWAALIFTHLHTDLSLSRLKILITKICYQKEWSNKTRTTTRLPSRSLRDDVHLTNKRQLIDKVFLIFRQKKSFLNSEAHYIQCSKKVQGSISVASNVETSHCGNYFNFLHALAKCKSCLRWQVSRGIAKSIEFVSPSKAFWLEECSRVRPGTIA